MGRSHFASGILATEATAQIVHYSMTEAVTGLIVGSCAALLPDIDHPSSTVSRTFGPLSQGFAHLWSRLMGGHRAGTHCIAGILALGAVSWLCVSNRHNVVAMSVLSAILIVTLAAGVRTFRIPGWLDDVAPVPIVLGLVCFTDVDLSAVPAALMLGCAVHVAGDCLTNSGCPIFWPFSRERLSMHLFSTGKWAETWIVYPLLLVGVVLLAGRQVFSWLHPLLFN
jgi:membrane-bound metal-dependent hydrolase YbcI (DUF457 family)